MSGLPGYFNGLLDYDTGIELLTWEFTTGIFMGELGSDVLAAEVGLTFTSGVWASLLPAQGSMTLLITLDAPVSIRGGRLADFTADSFIGTLNIPGAQAVPEPGSLALAVSALAGLSFYRLRRRSG